MTDPPYFFVPEWPVFFEDNHLLALYKPSGILVQGDRTADMSLLELARLWLKHRYGKPGRVFLGLVHRLDRPVAGVILFCRTSKAAGRLSEQFRTGSVQKRYLAVVEGIVRETSGRLIDRLERIPGRSSRIVSGEPPGSQEARLAYRVLDTHGNRSLVAIDLETGRHHQIRAQMAHMGHPVVGDLRYGAPGPLPHRQVALVARELVIAHPTLPETRTFSSPCPHDWPWPQPAGADIPPWNWSEIAPQVMAAVNQLPAGE